jgi:hypothetical protein
VEVTSCPRARNILPSHRRDILPLPLSLSDCLLAHLKA